MALMFTATVASSLVSLITSLACSLSYFFGGELLEWLLCSNPGAWLILRHCHKTWKPWGRAEQLEAWQEGNGVDVLSYRFELSSKGGIDNIPPANSTISTKNGGKFSIGVATGSNPMNSPNSSFDLSSGSSSGSEFRSTTGSGSWAHMFYRGFVMSATVEGEGKCSWPEV
ncbi:Hypothetical predicted protein [Olea europaea subsp. europaea]|uniref:Uncharacterized protein n=1 Tax=Olea europaea subsp. europaea TaxID=158383 RepID=A0A8S0URP2_OLEEU|nr:Hypothetical predicted protein [Olea europaea subsp. europaea]